MLRVGGIKDRGEELVEAGEAAGKGGATAAGVAIGGVGVGDLGDVFKEGAHDSVERFVKIKVVRKGERTYSWRWLLPVLVGDGGVGQTLVVDVYVFLPPYPG